MSDVVSADLNTLGEPPVWGIHRKAITAADVAAPSVADAGLDARGWKSVWVDAHFKAATGTQTATLTIWFWSPCALIGSDGTYSGAWFLSGITDMAVVGGDSGHKCSKIDVDGRRFWIQAKVLGSGAELHVAVAGAEKMP